jgi:predicted nucleic acid-binding protein
LKLFVDTWGWLALADRGDEKHGAAAECYRERSKLSRQVVTSNFVLDELLTLLFLRLPFGEAAKFASAVLASPAVTTEMVTRERFKSAMELRLRFADKPRISFTDLTSMVIMKEVGISEVMTADSHFLQVGMGFQTLPR